MTASQSEKPVSAVWFLLARGGTSTIRITPGLTLREDDQGELQVLKRRDPGGWLRFELEDGALWAQIVSPRWTLGTSKRLLGDRLRLDDTLELVLPHHVFQISDSLLAREDRRRPQVRLVGRPEHQAANVAALPESRPHSGRWKATPTTATPTPPPSGSDLQIAIQDRAQESPPTSPSRSAPGLWERSPDRDPAQQSPPTPPSRSDRGLWERSPDRDPAQQSPPTPPSRSVRPAAKSVSATPSVIRVPAERWRPERQSAPRPARTSGRASWADSVATGVFLAALLFSPMAGVPGGEAGAERTDAAGHSDFEVPPGELIGQAEALLAASPNDRATLEFAVEAYRVALSRGTQDPGRAARLAELEARLRRL